MPDIFLVNDNGQLCLETEEGLFALEGQAASLDWLLTHVTAEELPERLLQARGAQREKTGSAPQAPVETQEIWAAGVTYKRSEEARERESHNSTVYTRVYNAARPEIFFKALGPDAIGTGEPAGIRADARWSVPEPELVVVFNARMEVIGFTVGNDMSSRDIEGENPLYLPQAKVYERSCVVGPRIWLQPGANAWPDVTIKMHISRAGGDVFSGTTSTEQIKRSLADLREYLGRCKRFARGVLLFTGTGIVPPDDFTLEAGDEVHIQIEPIGELVNSVAVVGMGHSC